MTAQLGDIECHAVLKLVERQCWTITTVLTQLCSLLKKLWTLDLAEAVGSKKINMS
jgi:hypothetical protein